MLSLILMTQFVLRDTTFFNSASLFADSLVWDLGNGLKANIYLFRLYMIMLANMILLYMPIIQSGCSDTVQGNSSLVVLPAPIADFSFINRLSPDKPLSGSLEFTNTSLGAVSYLWDFGNGDISIEQTPTYNYELFYRRNVLLHFNGFKWCRMFR